MFPPKPTTRYAVTDPKAMDAAMYSCQTNYWVVAWFVWRIIQRGGGGIVILTAVSKLYERP